MADLIVRIAANSDKFNDELGALKKQTQNLEKDLAKVAKISGVAFAGLTATLGVAVNRFAKFDNAMRGVKTLLDETSFGAKGLEKGFQDMTKQVLDIGNRVPVELDKMTKALFDTVSAGVDASEATMFLEESAKLAVAGLTDVAVATDGMTSALNAYGLNADQAGAIADKFFLAQKKGKTTVEELAAGFGLVGSTASAMGVELNELFAAVSAATTAGIKTNAAYTGLKAVLANIAKPTKEAADEAARLGVAFDGQALKAKGLEKFLGDLTSANGFTDASITKLFGSVEAANIIFALTGKQAGNFAENIRLLGNESDAAATRSAAFAEQAASLSNQFQKFTNNLNAVAVSLGERLAPAATAVLESFNGFFEFLERNPEVKTFAEVLTIMATAATGAVFAFSTLGIALVKFRALAIAAGLSVKTALIASGIGILAVVVADLAINWEKRINQMKAVWESFTGFVSSTVDSVAQVFGFGGGDSGGGGTGGGGGSAGTGGGAAGGGDGGAGVAEQKQAELDATIAGNEAIAAANEEAKILADETAQVQREEAVLKKEEELAEDMASREAAFMALMQQDAKFKEAFNSLDTTQREKVKAELIKQVNTEKKIKEKAAKDAFEQAKKNHEEEAKQADLRNKALAKIEEVKNNEIYKGNKKAFGELGQLVRSENEKLKAIGKAAAIANIIIRTAESAMAIFAGFSTIPIVGIALGIAGAAAAVAFGAEQVSKVASANQGGVIGAQMGGRVPGGGPNKDSVPAFLTPGELITPRNNFEETVNAVADARENKTQIEESQEFGDDTGAGSIMVGFDGEEAANVLTVRQIENAALGVSREG